MSATVNIARKASVLPACLCGAGCLGHTWCVTSFNSDGSEHLYLQSSDAESAVKYFDELGEKAAHIYTRAGKTWKRVRRSAASIA